MQRILQIAALVLATIIGGLIVLAFQQEPADWLASLLTPMVGAAAIAQAFFAYWALEGLRHGRASADAAVRQASVMMAAERAYVFFHDAKFEFNDDFSQAILSWHNAGRTPAIVTSLRIDMMAQVEPLVPHVGNAFTLPRGAVIAGGKVWTWGTIKLNAKIFPIKAGAALFLSGEIKYLDVHQVEHRTWFCRRLNAAKDQFVLGDLVSPELNGFD